MLLECAFFDTFLHSFYGILSEGKKKVHNAQHLRTEEFYLFLGGRDTKRECGICVSPFLRALHSAARQHMAEAQCRSMPLSSKPCASIY